MIGYTFSKVLTVAILFLSINIFSQPLHQSRPDSKIPDFIFNKSNLSNNNCKKTSGNRLLLDSIQTNSISGSESKHILTYDFENNLIEWLTLSSYGSRWENSFKNEYFYDPDNNLLQELNLGWTTDQWDSLVQINYTYLQGNIFQQIIKNYTLNHWVNYIRTTYSYTPSGYLEKTFSEVWTNDNWENLQQNDYSYNQVNKTDSILFLTWDGNNWLNYFKTKYFYSSNLSEEDSIIAQSWSGTNWINFAKRIPSYNSNHNQVELIDQNWEMNNWVNSLRVQYLFNGYNYITSAWCEVWDINQWENGDGDIIFKNPDGMTTGFYTNELDAYYSDITNTGSTPFSLSTEYLLYQNYPNPFNPTTQINYSIPKAELVTLKVYDILGNEAAVLVNEEKTAGKYSINFNAGNLSSGVYFYRLKAGNYSSTKKLILMK